MKNNLSLFELNAVKEEITSFLKKLEELDNNGFLSEQSNKDFIMFLAKKIIFLKYLYQADVKYPLAVLISDFFFLILSIIKSEIRYIYLNERSIIENFTRYIMEVPLEDSYVTYTLLEQMNQKFFKHTTSQSDFSLIKGEYSIACNYVHGGEKLEKSLISVLAEYTEHKIMIEQQSLCANMIKLINIFIHIIVSCRLEVIDSCFHRKKSVLRYLIGKSIITYHEKQ